MERGVLTPDAAFCVSAPSLEVVIHPGLARFERAATADYHERSSLWASLI